MALDGLRLIRRIRDENLLFSYVRRSLHYVRSEKNHYVGNKIASKNATGKEP